MNYELMQTGLISPYLKKFLLTDSFYLIFFGLIDYYFHFQDVNKCSSMKFFTLQNTKCVKNHRLSLNILKNYLYKDVITFFKFQLEFKFGLQTLRAMSRFSQSIDDLRAPKFYSKPGLFAVRKSEL